MPVDRTPTHVDLVVEFGGIRCEEKYVGRGAGGPGGEIIGLWGAGKSWEGNSCFLGELMSVRRIVYPIEMNFNVEPIAIWLPSSQ